MIAEKSMPTYKQDGQTTYCYYTADRYSAEMPARDSSDILASYSGSKCPVSIKVEIAKQVTKNEPIQVKYKAVVDDSDKAADFEFPLSIAQAAVPENLLATSNNAAAGSQTDGDVLYDVPVSNMVVCDYRGCDLFTNPDTFSGNYYPSSNNPQNFVDGVATFATNEVIVDKDAKYSGYVHLVVNIGGNSRADFVTFFPIQVGDLPGSMPKGKIVADSETTYCWTSKDVSVFDSSVSDDDVVLRTGDNCPASMTASVSSSEVETGEQFQVEWSLQLESAARTPENLVGEVSDSQAVRDPTTGKYSVVPVAVLSGCKQNADKAKCSTYAGGDSTTMDLEKFTNHNLTNGVATYSASAQFDEPGEYLLISRAVMQTVDGDRIDMAVYSTISVALPGSTSGSTFVYIGVGIGALILMLGLAFCYLRKRRSQRNMKDIPFRTPMPPPSVVDRSSQYTATSSNFLTHRSPNATNQHQHGYAQGYGNAGAMGTSAYPNTNESSTSFYAAGTGDRVESESFSLDPYGRNSFNDIGEDESIDMTIRPSDASKFSFQTGYDDESEWEYDTRSVRSDGQFSDYTDTQRGTFNIQTGVTSVNMPIMEEEDTGNQDPRSTTSSGWTVNT